MVYQAGLLMLEDCSAIFPTDLFTFNQERPDYLHLAVLSFARPQPLAVARGCAPGWIPLAQRPHLASWETEADHPADSMRFEDKGTCMRSAI